jgi:hypothetical protein
MFNLCYPLAALSLVVGTRAGPVGLTPTRRPLLGAVGRDRGTAPSAASPMPRLTIELLTQLQHLEQALTHLPQTVHQSATAFTDTVTLDLHVPGIPAMDDSAALRFAVVNWGTVATHAPPVAAAFTQAHLSPHDYLPLLTAVFSANVAIQVLGALDPDGSADTTVTLVTDTATVLAKNAEFAHLHQALMNTVMESVGESVTPVIPAGVQSINGNPGAVPAGNASVVPPKQP